MGEPTITSIKVNYQEGNQNKSRDIKFKGNFGFNLDGSIYTVKDGKITDKNGKEVTELNLARGLAYQFIGMSCTAESARDYTYSVKDINQASSDYNSGTTVNDVPLLKTRAASVVGTGAGRVTHADCNDGIYRTDYQHADYKNINTSVSVWLIK